MSVVSAGRRIFYFTFIFINLKIIYGSLISHEVMEITQFRIWVEKYTYRTVQTKILLLQMLKIEWPRGKNATQSQMQKNVDKHVKAEHITNKV